MRKSFIAVLLLSAVAFGSGQQVIAEENQSTTRSAPAVTDFTITSGSSIGKSLDLGDVDGFRVSVCAESGQTLSGAGTLNAYLLDSRAAVVMRNASLDLTVTAASVRCQVFPDQEVKVGFDRVIYAASGVTVSGGTTVDVRIRGIKKAAR